MNIKIRLEIHAYAEEKLCDEFFDEPPFFGINGPEVMLPLSKKRGHIFHFEYNEETLVRDVMDTVKREIWGTSEGCELAPISYSFLLGSERYYIYDDTRHFGDLVLKILDPSASGYLTVCILVSCDAGDVGSEWPLRFYVHSKESGRHNEAHIHVCDVGHQYEASVRISDGEVIAGNLPKKLAKLAKEKILSDQNYFYNCWNTMTDGLKVDINHHYGYIQY